VKHLIQAPDGRRLTIAEKLVLGQLADDHNEDERCAWPSVPNLAARACMTEEWCRKLLRKLEASGVLESTPRVRDNGGRSSNGYRFPQIDPPFDKKAVAHAEKVIRHQAAMRAKQPVQMRLSHNSPPESQFGGGPNRSSGGGGTPVRGEGELQFGGGRNSSSGGKELPTELPGDLSLKPANDPTSPPPPDKRGANSSLDPVMERRWGGFKAALKDELHSVPHTAGLKRIRAEEHDYDASFKEWWLLDAQRLPNALLLVTYGSDEAATEAGIAKYKTRLEKLVRKHFELRPTAEVYFEVRRPPAARRRL
jgi:hypothetical protein